MSNVFNFSSPRRRPGPDMTIAWEMQPSLQHLVVRAGSGQHAAPTWAETLPAALDAFDESSAFSEPLEGLSIRLIHEPEIFRAFFGEAGAAVRAQATPQRNQPSRGSSTSRSASPIALSE